MPQTQPGAEHSDCRLCGAAVPIVLAWRYAHELSADDWRALCLEHAQALEDLVPAMVANWRRGLPVVPHTDG